MLELSVARAFYGNFSSMRPAQAAAVTPLTNGQDTIVLAGTGSGKTEATVAPLVSRYLSTMQVADSPVLMYVAPTRALVNDVFKRIQTPLDKLGVASGVRHGEANDLDRAVKPAVLVTTPESLDVMLSRRQDLLGSIRVIVIDEAHLLYNTQRGMQLAIVIERLEVLIGHRVQVAAMSATVADHLSLWSFYRPGRDLAVVHDPARRDIEKEIRLGWSADTLANALDTLATAVGTGFKTLVFTDSRKAADNLASTLRDQLTFTNKTYAHHSSLSKEERLRTEKEFAEFRSAVCVATSTLELGIDIGDIDLVVLWGRPLGWESFLQRIGRGNRRSGTTRVLCVVPGEESLPAPSALGFQAVLSQVDGALESPKPFEIYGAACQQVVSMCVAASGRFVPARVFETVLSPWRHLDKARVRQLLSELVEEGILVKHPVTNSFGTGDGAHELVETFDVWSNYPTSARVIPVFEGSHHLGDLQGQNLARIGLGSVFTFAGSRYVARMVRRDTIRVEKTQRPVNLELKYNGTGAPLDATLVEAMWDLLRQGDPAEAVRTTDAAERLNSLASHFRGLAEATIPYWRDRSRTSYLTFAGIELNTALASWLGGQAEATEIAVHTEEDFVPQSLPKKVSDLRKFLPPPPDDSLTNFQLLLPLELLRKESDAAWATSPVYQRTVDRLRRSTLVEITQPLGLVW